MPFRGVEPSMPWRTRYNSCVGALDGTMDWLSLATAAALWHRVRPMPASGHLFLFLACLCFALNIAWRRATRHKPAGGSWNEWREAPAAVFRLFGFGAGAGCAMMQGFLQTARPLEGSGPAAAAFHWGVLALASFTPHLLLLFIARPCRIYIAVPVQLAVVYEVASFNRQFCAAPAMGASQPAAAHMTQLAYNFLSGVRYIAYPPIHHATSLPPQAQCAVLLTYLQLTVGFAGPALAQLVFESSLFRRHCEERRRAGLPQETGLQASLYSCIAETWGALDTPLRLIALCLLLGALFDASLLLDAAMHGPAVS